MNVAGLVGDQATDVPIDDHTVGLEWRFRRATEHRPGPDVELRAVQRTRDRAVVDGAFTQRTSPMRARGLRGAEPVSVVRMRCKLA